MNVDRTIQANKKLTLILVLLYTQKAVFPHTLYYFPPPPASPARGRDVGGGITCHNYGLVLLDNILNSIVVFARERELFLLVQEIYLRN